MNWLQKINEMAIGYQNATILLTCVRVGVFEALGRHSRPVTQLAVELGLDERALDRVMCALVGMGILIKDGDTFALEAEAQPFLLSDSSDTLVSILGHHENLLHSWGNLAQVLQTGRPVDRPQRTEQQLRDFICGMENVSRKSSLDVAEKIDLSQAERLLDLGGGPGTAALTFARRNPALQCVVFDLAGPIEIAQEQIQTAGLSDRVTTRAGDFLADELGSNFDVVYISNIIHMLSPDQTGLLLRKSRQALKTGGRILIKDFYLDDSRTAPASGARFSVNMLVGTPGGKTYTRAETLALLTQAGFDQFECVDVATESQVIVGYAG